MGQCSAESRRRRSRLAAASRFGFDVSIPVPGGIAARRRRSVGGRLARGWTSRETLPVPDRLSAPAALGWRPAHGSAHCEAFPRPWRTRAARDPWDGGWLAVGLHVKHCPSLTDFRRRRPSDGGPLAVRLHGEAFPRPWWNRAAMDPWDGGRLAAQLHVKHCPSRLPPPLVIRRERGSAVDDVMLSEPPDDRRISGACDARSASRRPNVKAFAEEPKGFRW